MTQPIFLIGARGCGKTTVGKSLANALGFHFLDTDLWLHQQTQMTVAEIVEKQGWEGFRAWECAALRAVTAPAMVIATGGGMVLADENRQFMREGGVVVYLNAPASVLAARLAAFPDAGQRPTLTGKSIVDEVTEVLAAREQLYRDAAHHIIDATRPPPQIVSATLVAINRAAAG